MNQASTEAGRGDPRPADEPPIVEAIGVSKRYGATVALSDAHIRVMPGESHALVGRNGAGKSTLVGILTGLRSPDTGEVRFSGEPAPPVSDRAGWRARVACVYQHSTIIPDLTVAENLFVNRQPLKRGLISWGALRREARQVLARWNIAVSEDMRAGDLRVEARQLVEIARALSYGARFIILDEPTAQLDGEEIKRLFVRIRELQGQGVTFLFISHHLQEVYEICQAVTVLRDACHIVSAPVADLPKDRLIEAMTGEQVNFGIADAVGRIVPSDAALGLEVNDLAGEDFRGVSFAVRRGEVVGISGATSSGRVGVAEAVAGLGRHTSGAIRIVGSPLPSGNVPAALALGVGCVPKSRHVQGLVLSQSVADNTTMSIPDRLGSFGFIAPKRKTHKAWSAIRDLGVVTEGPDQLVSDLSGGNQQKVVMGRALANDPSVLVLMDPTAGVDVKSKEALLAVVERMRREGKAILVVSGELEDLRTCDRVLVMRHGSIVAEHKAGWSDNALVASIEGILSVDSGNAPSLSVASPSIGSTAVARLRDLALVPALLLLIVVGSVVSPYFMTQANVTTILTSSAALAMVVLAESLIIITGKFDLSLESTFGFAPAIGALAVLPALNFGFGLELPAGLGLLVVLLVGAAIGFVNGLLVVGLKLNAFIVTLAMLIIVRGMLVGATSGRTLFDLPEPFYSLMTITLLSLPLAVWLAAASFVIAGIILRYHRLGRALYAIGGNPEAARAAGIRVERITWGVYIVAGVLASIGGLFTVGYVGAISANQGNGMIFTVFAAAVIGGISLDGGKGTMFGALTGVLLLGVVQNVLTLAQVPSFWIQAIYGAIILGSLAVARFTTGQRQD